MWILIIGPSGSGKNMISEFLVKSGFEYIKSTVTEDSDDFTNLLKTSQENLRLQIKAASLMDRKDVVTIKSFWDSHDIEIPIFRQMQRIDDRQLGHFSIIRDSLYDVYALRPPSAVIYVRTNKMSAMNRMALRSVVCDQSRLDLEIKMYEDFISKIAVPLVELDGTRKPEDLKKELDFGVASLKSASLVNASVWQKHFFR